MLTRITSRLPMLALVASAAIGCADGEEDPTASVPRVGVGVLEQAWTIEGSTDPALCARYGADLMRVVVLDEGDNIQATEFAPCDAFVMRPPLVAGNYTGNATFLTAAGGPVSATLPLPPFVIVDEGTTRQLIDFPAAAMVPP